MIRNIKHELYLWLFGLTWRFVSVPLQMLFDFCKCIVLARILGQRLQAIVDHDQDFGVERSVDQLK